MIGMTTTTALGVDSLDVDAGAEVKACGRVGYLVDEARGGRLWLRRSCRSPEVFNNRRFVSSERIHR